MIMIVQDFLATYIMCFVQMLSSAIVMCRNVRKINVKFVMLPYMC